MATDANLDGTVSGRELKAWLNEEADVSQDKSVKSLGACALDAGSGSSCMPPFKVKCEVREGVSQGNAGAILRYLHCHLKNFGMSKGGPLPSGVGGVSNKAAASFSSPALRSLHSRPDR